MELIQVQEKGKEMKSTRQHPRYPLSLTVTFEAGASLAMQKPPQEEADGNTQNLSEGGLCLTTDRALEESQIIKIRLPIPNVHATIPTLAEVRWVKRQAIQPLPPAQPDGERQAVIRQAIAKQNGSHRYIAGLRFLF